MHSSIVQVASLGVFVSSCTHIPRAMVTTGCYVGGDEKEKEWAW